MRRMPPQYDNRPAAWNDGEEEADGLSPVQYVLCGIATVLLIAVLTFGVFWVSGQIRGRSARKNSGGQTEELQTGVVPLDPGNVITILGDGGQVQTTAQTEATPAVQETAQAQTAPVVPETTAQTEATEAQTQPPAPQTEGLQTVQPQTEQQTETQPTEVIQIMDPSGQATQQSGQAGDYILPESSTRLLAEGDVAGMSYDDMQMAINEIYARHGRIFGSSSIQSYFESKSWYQGTTDAEHFSDLVFSTTEAQNIQFLLRCMGIL